MASIYGGAQVYGYLPKEVANDVTILADEMELELHTSCMNGNTMQSCFLPFEDDYRIGWNFVNPVLNDVEYVSLMKYGLTCTMSSLAGNCVSVQCSNLLEKREIDVMPSLIASQTNRWSDSENLEDITWSPRAEFSRVTDSFLGYTYKGDNLADQADRSMQIGNIINDCIQKIDIDVRSGRLPKIHVIPGSCQRVSSSWIGGSMLTSLVCKFQANFLLVFIQPWLLSGYISTVVDQ
ncbi:conserved hypothetical protein [Trichinella spiralis]|uniref:hypothetical protein n=1 Tax=Trichinella spiralis TaxID=6334 RepID=UPI0001EFDDC8|nr:conserved hypothetical protein [Trichinella spiralis]